LRREIFRRALTRAHHAARLREIGKSYVIKTTYPARRISALLGKRWTSRGWLVQPEDVFFLTVPDLQQIVDAGDPASAGFNDLPALVAARRQAYEHWFEVEILADIDPDGKPVELRPTDEQPEHVLQGIAVSAGRVRGPARVIHDPRQAFHMQPGEILVTRATDAGWTPVFPLIGGVVTELGGQLSHAAILAREYGLPAVVSVNSAARLIRDGQTITLDGTMGQIQLEEAEETQ
jgi:pyruvate,water dikinase